MKIFIFLFLCAPLFSQDPAAQRIYEELRSLHAGKKAAPAFQAKLSPSSARRLLQEKIPGKDWYVQVNYNINTGLSLSVLGTDVFYEKSLSQYEQYINEMLLPLLATRAYERFKNSFEFSQPKPGLIGVGFKKGDIQILYYFQTGDNGLLQRLDYYEDKERKYVLRLQWEEVNGQAVPKSIKAVSYAGSRSSGEFELIESKITD